MVKLLKFKKSNNLRNCVFGVKVLFFSQQHNLNRRKKVGAPYWRAYLPYYKPHG